MRCRLSPYFSFLECRTGRTISVRLFADREEESCKISPSLFYTVGMFPGHREHIMFFREEEEKHARRVQEKQRDKLAQQRREAVKQKRKPLEGRAREHFKGEKYAECY